MMLGMIMCESTIPSRFASGSKDGTARIWTFRQGEWHSSQLIMRAEDGRRVYFNTSKQAEEPLR
jgi:hypothetical protein